MPVAGTQSRECPFDIVPVEAVLDVRIVCHVQGVIEVEKFKSGNRPVDGDGDANQAKRNKCAARDSSLVRAYRRVRHRNRKS